MPREFSSAANFRASVDQRLRNYAKAVGVPIVAVRRQAALERLIARLMNVAADRWALKGGLALDTRMGSRARTSLDMDFDHREGDDAAREDLAEAMATDLGDHFTFALIRSENFREGDVSLAERYTIDCAVAGEPFETVHVDVTLRPPATWEVESAQRPGLLAALGLGPIEVMLVPLERQIAEKLHAYTRTYGKGKVTTRVRDLVDLMLVRTFERPVAQRLGEEIHLTFASRHTHDVPKRLPGPPASLAIAYATEAAQVGMPTELSTAHALVTSWLDPVLNGGAKGHWDPENSQWSTQ
jgi:hypothetical protein